MVTVNPLATSEAAEADADADAAFAAELSNRTLPSARIRLATFSAVPSLPPPPRRFAVDADGDADAVVDDADAAPAAAELSLSLGARGLGSALLPGLARLVPLMLSRSFDPVTAFADAESDAASPAAAAAAAAAADAPTAAAADAASGPAAAAASALASARALSALTLLQLGYADAGIEDRRELTFAFTRTAVERAPDVLAVESAAAAATAAGVAAAGGSLGAPQPALASLLQSSSPWLPLWRQAVLTLEASLPLPPPLAGIAPRLASLLAYVYWRVGRSAGLFARASLDAALPTSSEAGDTNADADTDVDTAVLDCFVALCPSMRDALYPFAGAHWVGPAVRPRATPSAEAPDALAAEIPSASRFQRLRRAIVEPARRRAWAAAADADAAATAAVAAVAGGDEAAAAAALKVAESRLHRANGLVVTAALSQLLLLGFDVAVERATDYIAEQETLAEPAQALIALALTLAP
jgi:hypothetical protein